MALVAVVDRDGGERAAVGTPSAQQAHRVRLLEGDAARVDVHADALVERDRAGRVLGVDVERDARRAATPELGERRLEQRLAEPLAAPGGPDSDRADVSPAGDVRVVASDGGELVAVADDEPDWAALVAVLAPPAARATRRTASGCHSQCSANASFSAS